MANPNISLLGATYSGVSGVTLPTSGGGTATFPFVEGSQTITTNNTYDVTSLAQVIVNVAGSVGYPYETGTWTTNSNIARPTVNFTNSHQDAPAIYYFYDGTGSYFSTGNTNHFTLFFDFEKILGAPLYSSDTDKAYAFIYYRSRTSSAFTGNSVLCSHSSSESGNSDTSYPKYWVTAASMYPYCNSSSRYWRANRTYKWIALWKP